MSQCARDTTVSELLITYYEIQYSDSTVMWINWDNPATNVVHYHYCILYMTNAMTSEFKIPKQGKCY